MISYEFYKVLHVFSVIGFVSLLYFQLNLDHKDKKMAIFSGIFTLLVLTGGMGLLARLNISHTHGWPLWVKLKLTIWLLLGLGIPVINKRFPQFKRIASRGLFFIVLLAVILAVYKL